MAQVASVPETMSPILANVARLVPEVGSPRILQGTATYLRSTDNASAAVNLFY